jgi:putative transposase
MSKYRRAKTGGAAYFFTVVTYRRQPILCLDESRAVLKQVVSEIARNYPFNVDAWVLLPDHLHCIWTLPEADSDYSTRWALIKKEFTKSIIRTATPRTPNQSRTRHREGTVWQRRFWEHQIRDDIDYNNHMNYVHFNPVKHKLVESPRDWPYSTFHRLVAQDVYEENWGCGNDITLPEDIGRE